MPRMMASTLHVVCLFASVASFRKFSKARSSGANPVDTVACPVLSSLVNAGHLIPDTKGRVHGAMVAAALMATGTSEVFAGFQSSGIVAFTKDDIHQKTRLVGNATTWFNVHTMHPRDTCDSSYSDTSAGYPCNANTFYQQHAFSTRIMDPATGGSAQDRKQRFWDVFDDVLGDHPKGWLYGRALLKDGVGKLLARARAEGDFSGENSLNATGGLKGSNMAYFHPSVTDAKNYKPLAQWQATLAWSGFWVAFSREYKGVEYMAVGDLESMFLEGKFPSGWTKRSWGFNSTFHFLVNYLKGTGAGDEIVAAIEGIFAQYGDDASEQELAYALSVTLAGFGSFNDQVSYSPR